jgi:hypothetical protein
MSRKTIRRSVRIRRSPVPSASSVTSGFLAMLSKLSSASDQLNRARRRR